MLLYVTETNSLVTVVQITNGTTYTLTYNTEQLLSVSSGVHYNINKYKSISYVSEWSTEISGLLLNQIINKGNVNCKECRGCVGCVNCEKCDFCVNCNSCENCSNCYDCSNCKLCENCYNCSKCTICDNCSTCKLCDDCCNCTICDNCTKCEKCDECVDCRNCYKCENINGKSSYNYNQF